MAAWLDIMAALGIATYVGALVLLIYLAREPRE